MGRTRADFADDWGLPATIYRLAGPRISGTVTVRAEAELACEQPPVLEDCDVRVLLGHGDPDQRRYHLVERKDLDDPLTVNGVKVARRQRSTYFHPALLADEDRCGGHLSWELPDRTRQTAGALLRFVAMHWVRRDPEFLIHRISAVQHGLAHWQAQRRTKMTRLHRELIDRHETLDRLRAVGYDAHLYRLAPPPGPRSEGADWANDTTTQT